MIRAFFVKLSQTAEIVKTTSQKTFEKSCEFVKKLQFLNKRRALLYLCWQVLPPLESSLLSGFWWLSAAPQLQTGRRSQPAFIKLFSLQSLRPPPPLSIYLGWRKFTLFFLLFRCLLVFCFIALSYFHFSF